MGPARGCSRCCTGSAKASCARRRSFRKLAPVSLEAEPPPEPIYDDDEGFYEWYQPDEMTRWKDLAAEAIELTPEEAVAAEEELRTLAPRTRLVYMLHDIHRLSIPEIAQAVGIPGAEVLRLLEEARRHAARKRNAARDDSIALLLLCLPSPRWQPRAATRITAA